MLTKRVIQIKKKLKKLQLITKDYQQSSSKWKIIKFSDNGMQSSSVSKKRRNQNQNKSKLTRSKSNKDRSNKTQSKNLRKGKAKNN